jgi:hypothetical protein
VEESEAPLDDGTVADALGAELGEEPAEAPDPLDGAVPGAPFGLELAAVEPLGLELGVDEPESPAALGVAGGVIGGRIVPGIGVAVPGDPAPEEAGGVTVPVGATVDVTGPSVDMWRYRR